MQLGILLAVVAAIVISEGTPREPVGSAVAAVALTVAALLGVVSFAVIGAGAVSRAIELDADRRPIWLALFDRIKQIHLAIWLAMVAVILLAFDWPRVVRYNWGLERVIVLRDLLVLTPIWLPLLLSWGAFYEVVRATQRGGRDTDAGPHDTGSSFARRRRFVWLQARHYFGLGLLPIVMLLAYQDLLSFYLSGWREDHRAWLLYLVPVATLVVGFPWLLSRIWQTVPLADTPLRARLTDLSRRMGVRCREFRMWQTDCHVLNAAVAGILPSVRCVFLTDALVALLRDDELESVVAHELGHVRRRHLLWRMAVLLLPLWVLGVFHSCSPLTPVSGGDALVVTSHADGPLCTLVPTLATLVYAVLALGAYSRLLEHDADLCVFDVGLGTTFLSAMERLTGDGGGSPDRSSWLHPSTHSRIALLQRALGDPQAAVSYRAGVRRVHVLIAMAWVLAPLAALAT